MPRTKEQYAEMRDTSNQKIRSAAIRLFAENGFATTSIDDIAEAAAMSKGMMYRHYKSKDALFSSLLEAAIEGNREIARRMESDGDPREILEGIAAEIYGDMTQGEDFTNLMMLMTQGLMLKSLPDCNALIELEIQAIEAGAKLIRRGQKMGVFGAGNPQEISVCFFSTVQGLVMLKSVLGEHFQMPSVEVMTAFL
ncbi:MAG: TetR/AcrR family transcriptional regulator [Peptococcaceae bacterium]|jgi:AcrR family transcriptional regulator|nr:TetR/AcrR family transcriptional regulator [Peptococcaceae bacterium]